MVDLMKEIESKVSSLPSLQLNGLLFADDFVVLKFKGRITGYDNCCSCIQ